MKFYAVVQGRVPGIYTDWATTQKMINGYPKAIFKSFTSRQAAQEFLDCSNFHGKQKHDIYTISQPNMIIAYTDGSYTSSDRLTGFGVIVLMPDGDKIVAYGRVPDELDKSNNIAELYAIYVALSLNRDSDKQIILYSDSAYAIAALTVYVHQWIKDGWTNISNRNLIEPIYNLMKKGNVTLQHVDAHCGIELNEEVDHWANQGRLSTSTLTMYVNSELRLQQ